MKNIMYYFCCHNDIDLTYLNKYTNNIPNDRINIICNENNNINTTYNIIREPYNDLQCFYGENSRMIYLYKLYKEGKIELSNYISFNQYGRIFDFQYINVINDLLDYYDVIVHNEIHKNILSIYAYNHNINDFLEILYYVQNKYNISKNIIDYFLYNDQQFGHYNIFIMKSDIFCKYVEFIIDISDFWLNKHNIHTKKELETYINDNVSLYVKQNDSCYNSINQQMRLFGFITERLFTLWLMINKILYKDFLTINIKY